MSISFHQIHSLLITAECGSFAKAAERLYITPSALIQQVNSLEKHLKFKVFIRTNHGLKITPEGEYFLKQTQKLVTQFDECIAECQMLYRTKNTLRIGADPHRSCRKEYAEYQTKFLEAYPEYSFTYVLQDRENILSELRDQKYDLTAHIISKQSYDNKEVPYFLPIQSSEIVTLMLPSHPLAAKSQLSPEDLTNYPLAITASASKSSLLAWFKRNPYLQPAIIPSRSSQVMEFCLQGGIYFYPSYFIENMSPLVHVPIDQKITLLHGYLYNPTPQVKQFIEFVTQCMQANADR